MKLVLCVFVLYSTQINAKLYIGLTVTNSSDVTVAYEGSETKIISNEEINTFKIRNLFNALTEYYGRRPNNYYLKSPTPWGDLYKKYNWEQVTRVLKIKSARLKKVERKPIIVTTQDFFNYSQNKTVKVNTGVTHTVENSLTTSWSSSHEFSVSQEIEYDVNVIFAKLTGTTGISYTSSWGKTVEKTETVTIGTNTGMETELEPGQAATAVLSANKGIMEVEVVYVASLKGIVAVNYKKPYKGHHFKAPNIANVMKAGGLSNELETVETIKVGIYTDASLKVYDKLTGTPM